MGNYPTLRMKTEDKLYIINFEKDKDLIINFSDELLENKDIKILLKTMHYEDIKIEDTIAWDVYNCNSEDVIDDEIETILDTIVVDKSGRIHIKTTKGISISNYVNTFFDFKYIV